MKYILFIIQLFNQLKDTYYYTYYLPRYQLCMWNLFLIHFAIVFYYRVLLPSYTVSFVIINNHWYLIMKIIHSLYTAIKKYGIKIKSPYIDIWIFAHFFNIQIFIHHLVLSRHNFKHCNLSLNKLTQFSIYVMLSIPR